MTEFSGKFCKKCGVFYGPEGWYIRPSGRTECRACIERRSQVWRDKNREKYREWHRNYQRERAARTIIGRSVRLLRDAKYRASKKGLVFELDSQWVVERLERGCCEVTGMKFVIADSDSHGKKNPLSPSIDQSRANNGYSTENSRVVANVFNSAAHDWGEAPVIEMSIALAQ